MLKKYHIDPIGESRKISWIAAAMANHDTKGMRRIRVYS